MTDDDHNLDDLKDQLSRSFGVQVREDLQVRAEIVIQPEEGRWVFTPNELSDLAEGLRSVLLNSKPEGGWPFRLTLKQYVGLFDHGIPDGQTILNRTLCLPKAARVQGFALTCIGQAIAVPAREQLAG